MAAVLIHRLDSRRTAPAPGMRSCIRAPKICLCLDDTRPVPSIPMPAREPGADNFAGNLRGIDPEKVSGELLQCQSLRIKAQTRIGAKILCGLSSSHQNCLWGWLSLRLLKKVAQRTFQLGKCKRISRFYQPLRRYSGTGEKGFIGHLPENKARGKRGQGKYSRA